MLATKRQLEHALPFAMEPVVYDFAINPRGTQAELAQQAMTALMPPGYYVLTVPRLLRRDPRDLSRRAPRRVESLWRSLPHPAGAGRDGADAV